MGQPKLGPGAFQTKSDDQIQPDPSVPGGYLNRRTGETYAPGRLIPILDPWGQRYYQDRTAQNPGEHLIEAGSGKINNGTLGNFIGKSALLVGGALGGAALAGSLAGGGAAAGGGSAAGTGGGAAGTSAAITAPGASGVTGGVAGGAATGGASLGSKLLSVGQIAGKVVQGAAQGRAQEAQLGLNADQVALEREKQQNDQYRQAIRDRLIGGLLQGTQDVNISNLPPGVQMGTVTGGLRPSALTGANQTGQDLQRQAILTMLKGTPQVPGATPMPQPSIWEKILSADGIGASLYGAYNAPPPVKPPTVGSY